MHHSHHHHHHYHHHYYYHHHHQDMLKKNKIKNTCGCCGCYCCEWNLIPLVQSCIFSVSTFILLWLYSLYLSHQVHATARSRGFISSWFQDLAGNKPLTVLVKKVSVTKWINVPIKKRKVRKPEKLWQKAACISGAKSTEKLSFLYHLFVVVVVFVCVHAFSIKMRLIIKVNVIKLEQS